MRRERPAVLWGCAPNRLVLLADRMAGQPPRTPSRWFIETNLNPAPTCRGRSCARPEEVADLIASVIANAYLNNQSILLDGGWHPQ